MKVLCIFDFYHNPYSTVKGHIEYGKTYTVIAEHKGYSTYAKRMVDTYELMETEGYYEKGIFIPVDENKSDTLYFKKPHVQFTTIHHD